MINIKLTLLVIIIFQIHTYGQKYEYFNCYKLKSDEYCCLDSALKNPLKAKVLLLGHLSYNPCNDKLKKLPSKIGKLQNIEYLDLGFNHLTGLPKEITNLKNLKELTLQSNCLIDFPKEITELYKLKYLNLWCNYITKVPKEIGKLKNLETLLLGGNPYMIFPDEITQLTSLKKLDISEPFKFPWVIEKLNINIDLNKLDSMLKKSRKLNNSMYWSDLFNKLSKLPNLEELDLFDCNIDTIPPEIVKLKNLRILYLGNNSGIKNLPNEFKHLNLKELYFSTSRTTGGKNLSKIKKENLFTTVWDKLSKDEKLKIKEKIPLGCKVFLYNVYYGPPIIPADLKQKKYIKVKW